MIVFGLILVLLALGAGVALFLATQSLTTHVELELAGYSWGMTPLALLATGAAVLLVLWLGLAMIRGSVKRRRRPAREAKEAERQAKFEESIRADERERAEELHQSALAERDRVRDEEFQARLADHERERDTLLATRDQEFADREWAAEQRARENEQRIRAEERRRVEQEHASGGTAVVPESGDAGRHSADAEPDSAAVHQPGDSMARDQAAEEGTPGRVADSGGLADSGDSRDDSTEGAKAEGDSSEPAHRTVADKIMGRHPSEPS